VALTDRREAAPDALSTHLLLVDCPDKPGLVHAITGALLRRGANILTNHEFVDPDAGRFFMRTAFEGAQDVATLAAEVEQLLPGATVRVATSGPRRIVALATTEHHCLGELLLRNAHGELGASIEAVISEYPTLGPLVARFDLPFHHVPHAGLDRAAHEAAVLARLDQYRPDYIVLAKYMRVLSPAFVDRFPHRIINIHHSFLPAFVGASPYRQAFERGVKIIGATAHFVTEELDEGPIIAQGVLPVDHASGPGDMARAGRDVEKLVLAKALKLVFEERVFRSGKRTIVFE
jgi:formyltetrahydrofolate deformylase